MIIHKSNNEKQKLEIIYGRVKESPELKNYYLVESDRVAFQFFDYDNFVKLTLHLRREEKGETKVLRLWNEEEIVQGRFSVEQIILGIIEEEE